MVWITNKYEFTNYALRQAQGDKRIYELRLSGFRIKGVRNN